MNAKIKVFVLSVVTLSLTSCGMSGPEYGPGNKPYRSNDGYSRTPYDPPYSYKQTSSTKGNSNESEARYNPFVDVTPDNNTSNISLTSSTFSYPVVREAISHYSIDNAKYAARTEEMLNYFSYNYKNETTEALTTFTELDKCPWNNSTYLASVVVKGKPAETANVKNNFVILIDRSSSMRTVFNLVLTSLNTLIDKLGDDDLVSIVSYASNTKIEADGITGDKKAQLKTLVSNIQPSGSTFGEGGIEQAYNLANKHFIEGGNNRVVLLTDGDFNIGKVTGDELINLIEQKASNGIYLTCCGYRSFDNGTLFTLSEHGNGNAYYIDDEFEAKKVFDDEYGKAMFTIAKDTKCQIQFSPDAVRNYRLLGYEERQMSDVEFNDPNKDAGEIMSDHTTVALYELKLYPSYTSDYIFKTTLRYKDPVTNESKEVITTKSDKTVSNQADFDFASYVAEYCMLLNDDINMMNSSYPHLIGRINSDYTNDKYRQDFVNLVNKTYNVLRGIYE